ncbi:MAG: APC family permease [Gemmatimonadaceae bacterium]
MSRTLARTLGLRDLLFLTVGSVIGSGIFLVPATVLAQTGGTLRASAFVWLAGGILSLLGALTYAELAAQRPDAGGMYVFIRDAFGPMPAFLFGWTMFFVVGSGAVATLTVAFAGYLREFVPVSAVAAKLVAVAVIAVLTWLNVRGTRRSADVQTWTTAIKAGAILVLGLLLLAKGTYGAGSPPPLAQPRPSPLVGLGLAMIGVLWSYEGWQYTTFTAGEARDPQRTIPRGLIAGTAVLVGLYLLANAAYVAALGAARAARSERVAAEAVGAVLGPAAGKLVAAVILVAMFSAANALILTTPRVYFSMARDGVFFRRLAEVHPRFGTPALAIVAGSLWAMVLAATGTFEQLLTYVVFTGWIFYALAGASIFVFRRREPEAPRSFRVPGYPVTPALFVASAALIVANTVGAQPARAAVGLGVVLLGIPAYLMWRARPAPVADAA